MTSMYNESYIKPDLDPKDRHTKNDIQKQLLQLRSSNILMGTQGQDYNSMFMNDFVVLADIRPESKPSIKAKPNLHTT